MDDEVHLPSPALEIELDASLLKRGKSAPQDPNALEESYRNCLKELPNSLRHGAMSLLLFISYTGLITCSGSVMRGSSASVPWHPNSLVRHRLRHQGKQMRREYHYEDWSVFFSSAFWRLKNNRLSSSEKITRNGKPFSWMCRNNDGVLAKSALTVQSVPTAGAQRDPMLLD